MGKLRRRMPFAFLVMLIVLLVNVYVTRVNTYELEANSQESAESRRVLLELTSTLSTMKDAETGQRGYLIVGAPEYLEPYAFAVASIHEHVQNLQTMTTRNAIRRDDVAQLLILIDRKLSELAQTIQLYQRQGRDAAIALVRTGEGRRTMDAIRKKAGAMIDMENNHLSNLAAEARLNSNTRTYTFALATVAAIACVLAAFAFVRRDLIEREQAAEEAERQRELLSVTLTSVGDAVIATDPEGRVTFLNEVGEHVTGWTTEEAAGKPVEQVFKIINEETRQTVDSPAAKVLREGKIVGLANHTLLVRRDGTELPIEDSGAPIRSRAGEVLGVIIVFRDVSEAKKAQAETRAAESRFRTMADSAPVLVWIADTTKNCIWFNKLWLSFVGRTLEQEHGYGCREGVHPEDLEHCVEVYNRSFDAHESFRMEYRRRRHDGVYRWILDHGVPLYAGEGESRTFTGYIGTCVDITDRRELEAAREELLVRERAARAEAEAANHAKDDFLAVLSHELRTPLTPVLATVRALQADPNLDAHVREDLEMIRRNAELEARLIDDLLDLTRVAKNKVQLNLETVDVHLTLRRVLEICGSELEAKKQVMRIELGATRHHIRADAARLQQIFWNLVKNASKFTPEGGTITIHTTDCSPGRLCVKVQDTGIGIAKTEIAKLFEAFEQGNAGVARKFGGLGLGLAITKALVDVHGGDVKASSEGRGLGATFSLEFPVVDAPVAMPPANGSAPLPPSVRSLRILLVEDHADTLRTMSRLVRAMGHKVETATTVAGGVALALAADFDLILSDIGLPDGSGIELLERVRMRKQTPAIALTGFGMEEDVKKSLDAGFAAHLTKPVNFDRLESLIRQFGTGAGVPGGLL